MKRTLIAFFLGLLSHPLMTQTTSTGIDKGTNEPVIENNNLDTTTIISEGTPLLGLPSNKDSISKIEKKEIFEKTKLDIAIEQTIPENRASAEIQESSFTRIYGQELFSNKSISVFQNAKDSRPPSNYILNTGDELTISIFGASQFDAQFVIGKNGYIKPDRLPKIFLKGLQLNQAKQLLINRFSPFYLFKKDQFALSLSTARTITIHVFGEVNHAGSFTLPAVNTAFNALVAAGGPNDIGSVRNIKVIQGEKNSYLDVYGYMNNPDKQFDFFLNNNDIIHVPVAKKIITITGAVNRPYKYELKKEENLEQLIKFAGGLKANAYTQLVQIKRFDKNKQALIDINWAELIKNKVDFYLKNGDEVFFQSIEKAVESVVTIKGSVEFPGQYALTNTSNISDLLGKGILKPEARTDIGFLLRTNLDKTKKLIQLDLQAILTNPDGIANIALQKEDQLIVYEKARFVDTMAIKVSGAVRQQIEHPFDPDATITLQKAILLAGGLKPEARQNAYIIRTNPENSHQQEYIEVNIKEAINKPTSPANIILQPLDELKVLSKITYTDEATISISGQVRNPSEFKYATSLKLKDLITLSGGLKLGAALDRVDIYRLEIDSNNSVKTVIKKLTVDSSLNFVSGLKQPFLLKPYDEVVIRTVPDFEFQKYVQIKGEVKYAGKYALTKDNESLSSLIQRAGGVTKEAFVEGATIFRTENNKGLVVTKLDKVLSNKNTKYNYILKEGDIITIPTKEDLVTIQTINTRAIELYPEKFIASGKINVAYEMRKKAKWYIKEYANGFGANASKSSVSIEYPNGELKRTKNWVFFKIYPKVKKGSVILVGAKAPKTKKAKKERKPFDLQQVVSNVFSAISLTLTTVILARQL